VSALPRWLHWLAPTTHGGWPSARRPLH